MEWGNLRNWLAGDQRSDEQRATREAWDEAERLWRASPPATEGLSDIAMRVFRETMYLRDPSAATPVLIALAEATYDVLAAEDINAIEPSWRAVEEDMAIAIEFRRMVVRRKRWAADFERMFGIVKRQIVAGYDAFMGVLPEFCFGDWGAEGEGVFEVPLLELLDDPIRAIEVFLLFPYDDETLRFDLFLEFRHVLERNLAVASGYAPNTRLTNEDRVLGPREHKIKNPAELADLYLAGTPYRKVLDLPVPFHIPDEARFEHCHIIGGTGHGKTQLMQRMIHADLLAAQTEPRSVVVIDSQGDLINKLMRLALFDPDAPNSLADRLIVIDPADVEFPAALNLFDAKLDRIADYVPVDRERVLNGVVELYETFFGDLLGAELTQKQGVIFKYLARLMLTIPNATIHTLMQLMEDGKPFRPHMQRLDGSARYFFEKEFFDPSFSATKKQILKRLWGVLSTPAFERMFTQPANKLDLFEALNDGKIILINTAKDLLKDEGSQLFGRFFIAMLKQAALERSTIPDRERTPTFVYVDEAQEYFDDRIETILNQARKYHVGLTLAHQTLDQLSPRLRSALHSNTSLKCAGGVSAKDARGLADELHTRSEFIESMKRRGDRTEFAVWLKQTTPSAIRLSVPLGFVERQPTLTVEAYDDLVARNRTRYCGTLADVASGLWTDAPASEPEPLVSPVKERPVEPAFDLDEVERELLPRPAGPPRARPPITEREAGKGGPKHRYLQTLVKELGEQQGFRARVEAPLPSGSGQVDVLLERGDLSVAFEVSVTTPVEWERDNVRKCLEAGYTRVALVLAKSKGVQGRYQTLITEGLSDADRGRVSFLSPEEVPDYIAALAAPPEPTESVVKGYRVKVSRISVEPSEAKARRGRTRKDGRKVSGQAARVSSELSRAEGCSH